MGGSTPSISSDDASLRGRLLVVDDEPFVLSYLARTLSSRGHEVVTASDGTSALRQLAGRTFDLILSDVAMPGLDGVSLLRAVRGRGEDIPIIFVTGNPDVASAADAVRYGALRYLTKPVRDADLHAVVREGLLARERTLRQRHALQLLERTPVEFADLTSAHAQLDDALSSMWMAYQPIFSVENKDVFAYEALLRTHSVSLPNPLAVLDSAEELGRMNDVGQRVRRLVAETLAREPSPLFFVNLHAKDLLDASLFEPDAPLTRYAKRVVLEITERAALDGVEDVPGRVRQLREMGFGLAVDDLGAGYAGLTSFAQLSPEFVKLDISLVRQVHQDKLKRKLVQSVTSMCHDLGITVVAEGVEVEEERATLMELGCNLLQGFLLGRPAPHLVPP